MEIQKVAVLGAGTMGMGIAAQVANAGIPVRLLDIVPKDAEDRNAIAKAAVAKALKTDPAPFMSKRAAKLIEPGNLEDDLAALGDCDWVVEVIIEDLEIKKQLYARLDGVVKPGAAVSSNTSTIPLNMLVEGRSEAFRKQFMITHFFNPPRYMRLLEMVRGPETDAACFAAVEAFADHKLGKGVVVCNDTPAFIANRIGTYWIQAATNGAFDHGLTVEEADAVVGRPMGIPKTGVFGLLDLVGIDLSPLLARSLLATLPEDDPYRDIYREEPLITKMIDDGLIGRKGKGGFYRLNREGGKRVKESIDLETGTYGPSEKPSRLPALEAAKAGGLRALVESDDPAGRYAWDVLRQTLSYAAELVGVIADTIPDIDRAMVLGYAWKEGPFGLLDQLGPAWFAERLAADGHAVPEILRAVGDGSFYRVTDGQLEYFTGEGYAPLKRPDGVLLLEDIKRARKPVAKNPSAKLWDIGDGVLCLEFTSKMNAMDPEIMAMIEKAIALIGDGGGDHKALVIYNEGTNFSVGANLGLAMFAINIALWQQVEASVAGGQDAYMALKFAPFPVVGAPAGMALGGGCEILLHCDAVQAAAETYMGLVEVGVGLVPGWGGCKEMLLRHQAASKLKGPMPALRGAFETIATAKVAKSAAEAQELLFLRKEDGITMNRDRLLADAKAKALAMVDGYNPPEPATISLPGPTGKTAVDIFIREQALLGKVTPHDEIVTAGLARVMSGGEDADMLTPLSEQDVLDLERAVLTSLVRTVGTQARIEHMLETGKPLRN